MHASAPDAAHMPDLGLLLDVDGPLASPVTRSLRLPGLRYDLVALAAAGVPIAFVTGRSDAFIRTEVVDVLRRDGLDEALAQPHARMYGVFEKGGAWAPITADGMGVTEVDEDVAFSHEVNVRVRDLVNNSFADTMFFDETKRAMISVEQRTDVSSEQYRAAQPSFDGAAFAILADAGVGVRAVINGVEHVQPNADGEVPFRLDPTIISTDIESIRLDKDRGAARALEYFGTLGPLPRTWVSVGDSRSDYRMADHLHEKGFHASHLDVRPSDGILDRPYPVLTEGALIHDDATAQFLSGWIAALNA